MLKPKRNLIVLNTKGGVGKTTISRHLLTYYMTKGHTKEDLYSGNSFVHLQEFEQTNPLQEVRENYIKHAVNRMDDDRALSRMIDKISFSVTEDFIIDVGGGVDALKIIEEMRGLDVEDEYIIIIPIILQTSFVESAFATYEFIKKLYPNAVAVMVFNKYSPDNIESGKFDVVDLLAEYKLNIKAEKNLFFSYIPDFDEDEEILGNLPTTLATYLQALLLEPTITYNEKESMIRADFKARIKEEGITDEILVEFENDKIKLRKQYYLFDSLRFCEHFFTTLDAINKKESEK